MTENNEGSSDKTSKTPSNFEDHPQSITELKAGRDCDMTVWTPRDALIALLRQIDGGMKVDAVVIVFRQCDEDGGTITGSHKAAPDIHTALGLLSIGMDTCHRQRHSD